MRKTRFYILDVVQACTLKILWASYISMFLVMLHDFCVAYVATEIEWQYPSGNIFPEKENIIKVHLFIKQLFVRSSLYTI